MPARERIVRHVALDPPIYLADGDVLIGKHIIQGGSLVGRVLFAEPSALIEIAAGARNALIAHCVFEPAAIGVRIGA